MLVVEFREEIETVREEVGEVAFDVEDVRDKLLRAVDLFEGCAVVGGRTDGREAEEGRDGGVERRRAVEGGIEDDEEDLRGRGEGGVSFVEAEGDFLEEDFFDGVVVDEGAEFDEVKGVGRGGDKDDCFVV